MDEFLISEILLGIFIIEGFYLHISTWLDDKKDSLKNQKTIIKIEEQENCVK